MKHNDEQYLSRWVSYRLDYDVPENLEKVETYAFNICSNTDVKCTTDTGGPCWSAYIIFEGAHEDDIKALALKTIRYIKRFKDHRFY